jgi:tetratricopeptide (TPR) repeat protein
MGVVWGAWDPELERRVAIKVMRPQVAAARERVVREGQALAKLSHPHVVPVYDVGVVDDQVYLVMEWVQGETLRAWTSEPRAPRDVARAYREAALGLAAAHEAGLVHRDFKPENAMLGKDGRVRVLDFGLAQAEGAAGVAGTPRYMAPEQRAGAEQTPAVDQYALGVALREALPDPPPKWLAAIIARATAEAPSARFATMHELALVLGNDPARVLRRRIGIGGAIVFAGAAFAIGVKAGDETERCVGEDLAWPAQEKTRTHVAALGPYGAVVAARIGGELDAYAKSWTTAHVGACKAHDRGELTNAIYTTNLACLANAKAALVTIRDVLGTTTRERLPDAVRAIRSLPAVEHCSLEITPPPAAIASRVAENGKSVASARVLALAADPKAIETAAGAARDAEAIGYARQIGRASLVHGLALALQQKRDDAVPVFERAADSALEAGDLSTAIEAIARRLFAKTSAAKTETLAELRFAFAIAKGLSGRDAFARALFYNNVGNLHLASDRDAAKKWFEEADRVRPPPSSDTFELAGIYGNLALVESDPAKRDALLARHASEEAAVLDRDHPMTLDTLINAAMFVEHPQRSADLIRDACHRYRRLHPHIVDMVEMCSYELAWLAEERGDLKAAADELVHVQRTTLSEGELAIGYRELVAGKHAEALKAMSELADRLASAPHFWRNWRAADAHIVVAIAADKLGDRKRAIAAAERALAAIDKLGDFATSTFVQRRRGRVLAMLALWGAGDVTARTAEAIAWAKRAGAYEERVAALTSDSRRPYSPK